MQAPHSARPAARGFRRPSVRPSWRDIARNAERGTRLKQSCARDAAIPSIRCRRSRRPVPPPPKSRCSAGGTRTVAAIAVGAVLLFVAIAGALFATTRDGGDHPTVQRTETPVETADETLMERARAYVQLGTHIPADVRAYGCESDTNAPATAAASAVCVLRDQDVAVQYWLFADSETMYVEYIEQLSLGEQVVEGDCPDGSPRKSPWESDGITRGLFTCLSSAPSDDAHVIWTHDDLLILSALSHVNVNADTASLMEFWSTSAGPE